MAAEKLKKTLAGLLAALSAAMLLVAGTFADEGGIAPLGAGDDPIVTLHDTGQPLDRWDAGIHSFAEKQVWASSASAGGNPAFVRIRFSEYLETFTLTENKITGSDAAPVLFATWPGGPHIGTFMKWDTRQDAETALAALGLALEAVLVDDDNDPLTPGKWYAQTRNEETGNGLYGRPLVSSYSKTPQSLFGGVAQCAQPSATPYKAHRWDGTSIASTSDAATTNGLAWYADESDTGRAKMSDYVQWNLPSGLMTLAEWQAAGKPAVRAWVLAEDGWCYWAAALAPGEETGLLMQSVQLKRMPGAAFQYEIHAEMQAVTTDALDEWALDAPADLLDVLKQAESALKKAEQLAALVNTADGYAAAAYTRTSWERLESCRSAASALLLEELPALNALTTCLNNLQDAVNGLVLRGDTGPLLQLMRETEGLNPVCYTATSWQNLQTAYEAAWQMAYSDNTTQAMADDAYTALLAAKTALVLV